MFGFVSWVVFVSSVRGSALSCALPVGRWIVLDRRAPAAPKVRLSQPKRKPVDAWTFVHGKNPIGISDCLLIILGIWRCRSTFKWSKGPSVINLSCPHARPGLITGHGPVAAADEHEH